MFVRSMSVVAWNSRWCWTFDILYVWRMDHRTMFSDIYWWSVQNIVGSICVATFRRRWKLPCSTRRPSKAIPGRPWLRNDMDRASVIIHHHFREKNSAEVRLSSSMRIPVTLTSAHIIYCSRSILFLEDSHSDHLYVTGLVRLKIHLECRDRQPNSDLSHIEMSRKQRYITTLPQKASVYLLQRGIRSSIPSNIFVKECVYC